MTFHSPEGWLARPSTHSCRLAAPARPRRCRLICLMRGSTLQRMCGVYACACACACACVGSQHHDGPDARFMFVCVQVRGHPAGHGLVPTVTCTGGDPGGLGGWVRGQKNVCVPGIDLQVRDPVMNFIFFEEQFSDVGGRAVGSGEGAQAAIPPPPPVTVSRGPVPCCGGRSCSAPAVWTVAARGVGPRAHRKGCV